MDHPHLPTCRYLMMWCRLEDGRLHRTPRASWTWACPACGAARVDQLVRHLDQVSGDGWLWVGKVPRTALPAVRKQAGRLEAGRMIARRRRGDAHWADNDPQEHLVVSDRNLAPCSKNMFIRLPRHIAVGYMRSWLTIETERVQFLGPWKPEPQEETPTEYELLGRGSPEKLRTVYQKFGLKDGMNVDPELAAEVKNFLDSRRDETYNPGWPVRSPGLKSAFYTS